MTQCDSVVLSVKLVWLQNIILKRFWREKENENSTILVEKLVEENRIPILYSSTEKVEKYHDYDVQTK